MLWSEDGEDPQFGVQIVKSMIWSAPREMVQVRHLKFSDWISERFRLGFSVRAWPVHVGRIGGLVTRPVLLSQAMRVHAKFLGFVAVRK